MLNIKSIIQSASTMLGIDELKDLTDINSLDERSKNIVGVMLYCFNEVYQELCCDYFPLIIEEKIELDNNCLYFNKLNKDINRLYVITDENHNTLNYIVLTNYARIYDNVDKVIVRYSYVPDLAQSIDDNVECSDLGISDRILALGVAAEYSLYRGKLSEATIFDNRYKDSIESAKLPTRRMYVKSRSWL